MAAEQNIIVRIRVDGAEKSAKLTGELAKEIDHLEKELKEATAGTDRYIAAQKQLASLQRSLKSGGVQYRNELARVNQIQERTAAASSQAAQGMGQFGGVMKLAKGAAAAFLAVDLLGRLKDLAQQGLKLAGEYENTQIAFEAFLGSADRGTALLAELNKFSIETPFTSEEVIRAGKSLVAVGITTSETTKLLRQLGNVAAGSGTNFNELVSIFAKFKTQGRLFQEDVNQLTGRGIPLAEELAKVLGTSEANVRKMTEAGKVGFPEVQKAIENLTAEGSKFGGLIEKQSKTFPGLISTLSGAWEGFLRVVAESTLLQPAKDGIEGLIKIVAALKDEIDPQQKINATAIEEIKAALGLQDLSKLTKNELDQRQEQINQALFEERKFLRARETDLRTFDERRENDIKKAREREARLDASQFGGLATQTTAGQTPSTLTLETEKKAIETEIATQKARIAAIEQANIDINTINENQGKIEEAKRESERADWLKLAIFRKELELETAKAISRTESEAGELRQSEIQDVIDKEVELSELRLRLANLAAKNAAQRKLNSEQEVEAVITASFEAQKAAGVNLAKIGEDLKKGGFKTTKEFLENLSKDFKELQVNPKLAEDIEEAAKAVDLVVKEFDKLTIKQEKAIILTQKLFGENGIVANFEKFAPQIFDIFGDIFSEQERQLDKLVSLQEKRVEDAAKIAENGNAEALQEERKRLAAVLAEQEKASKRSNTLAQIETRVQIGLAVAKAAAAGAGIGGIGALVIGGAVAVGLPALINNLPLFEKGGVVGGHPHSAGGTPLIAERGEFITNKRSSANFMPALKSINTGQADPAMVNAAATGNISNYFALQMKPIADRLESVEQAIRQKPESSFLIDENGWSKRQSTIIGKAGRISKIIG